MPSDQNVFKILKTFQSNDPKPFNRRVVKQKFLFNARHDVVEPQGKRLFTVVSDA